MESAKNCCTLEIFYRALRGEWISVKKIAEEYQVSTKTIGRYINDIQQFLSENRELMQNAEETRKLLRELSKAGITFYLKG